MKCFIAVLACSLGACGVAQPGEVSRGALDDFGLGYVEVSDGRYVLEDPAGGRIGEVDLTDGAVRASYRDQHVATRVGGDSWSAECNGRAVTGTKGIPSGASPALEPCRDALDIASQLAARRVGATPPARGASLESCIWLGINYWCDGSTLVYTFDSLCNNGEMSYTVSTTVLYAGDSYCYGLGY
jgi:hypothetical protein